FRPVPGPETFKKGRQAGIGVGPLIRIHALHPTSQLIQHRPDEGEGPGVADRRTKRGGKNARPQDPCTHPGKNKMQADQRREGDSRPAGEARRQAVGRSFKTREPVADIFRGPAKTDRRPEKVRELPEPRYFGTTAKHLYSVHIDAHLILRLPGFTTGTSASSGGT